MNCYFGDTEGVRGNLLCSKDVDMVLGMMFMEKLKPVFVYKEDGSSAL